MDYKNTKCFDIFRECVKAIHNGELIVQESKSDKEFHFQNWCSKRLCNIGVHFDVIGRNIYPDFCLVEVPEGYEVKGLAYPGREKTMMPTAMFQQVIIMAGIYFTFLAVILMTLHLTHKIVELNIP